MPAMELYLRSAAPHFQTAEMGLGPYSLCRKSSGFLRTAGVLLFIHFAICPIQHLVQRVTVLPFGNSNAHADLKILKITRFVPICEFAVDTIDYNLCSGCIRIGKKDQELVSAITDDVIRAADRS